MLGSGRSCQSNLSTYVKYAPCRCFRVYDIGIDVRFGQGRYRDTRIVTLATRYQLENRTHHTLAFSQRHFVREQVYKCLFLWKLLDLYSLRLLNCFQNDVVHIRICVPFWRQLLNGKVTFWKKGGKFLKKLWCWVGGRFNKIIGCTNWVDSKDWPTQRVYKADVSSVSPSSVWRGANGAFNIIDSADITKLYTF